ncbi:hypothetical protein ACDX34_11450 [Acinetobacter bereziniae]|uniref:hypothetical protein n=1 Tax=Acinetobacter bereziniae TaxID=106648 RepID=UPI0039C3F5CF
MNKSIFILIIAVLSCSSLNAKSLCLKDEEIYFSCQTGKKEISFCGKTNKFLEYRFGKPKKIEMSYRVDNSKNRNNKINQVVIGNDIFFFNKRNYYYSLSIPIKGYPALQIKKNQKLISVLESNSMGSWSGYNRFLTDINEDQIENLDNIL